MSKEMLDNFEFARLEHVDILRKNDYGYEEGKEPV